MTQETERDQMTKKRVVHVIPGMEATAVRRGEAYKVTDAGTLTMDLYYPKESYQLPAEPTRFTRISLGLAWEIE